MFLEFLPSVFGKLPFYDFATNKDNCIVNRLMKTKIGILPLGCKSHQFQLAVKEVFSTEENTVAQVKQLMMKFRMPIVPAKLCIETKLRPKLHNDTRWSSTYKILWLQTQLREYVVNLEGAEIDVLLLNPAVERKADDMVKKLEVYDVNKNFELMDVTL